MTGAGAQQEPAEEPGIPELTYDLKSAKEAADLLRVSESTVWRYAAQDILPAYRVGKKRVMFRRNDLESMLNRLRRKKEIMAGSDSLNLMRVSEGRHSGADAMARAKTVRDRILARRRGVPVGDSWIDINAAREERTEDL